MKKNILTGLFIIIFAVILGFGVLTIGIMNNPQSSGTNADQEAALFQNERSELDSISEDVILSGQDPVLFSEIDESLKEISQ